MKTYEFSADTRTFLENIPIPLAVYQYVNDQIKPLLVSKAYVELFGYSSTQEAVYGLGTDLYRNVHPDDISRMENYSYRFAAGEGVYDITFRNKRKDQSDYHLIHGTGKHSTVDGVNMAFITYTDVTAGADSARLIKPAPAAEKDEYSSSDSMEYVKYYDGLTGLQNMTHFLDYSMAGIGKIRDKGEIPVVLYFDLCDLKKYNSRYGLKAGDDQIRLLSELIGKYFGKERSSRFESDHFVVYSENSQIEERLRALFSEMKEQGGGNNLAVKAGISRLEKGGMRLTDACDRARIACESISETGVSAFAWVDDRLMGSTALKYYILRNFDKALKAGWIQVWYQPIIRTMTKTVCSAEALVRWMDPGYGMISPRKFIPVLEESGQIYRLDLYVFEQVCKNHGFVKQSGRDPVPVSVNLSRKDFLHDNLPEDIDRISQKYGIPREFTNLEITESAFVKNIDKVDPFIRRFRKMGYKVWMDDFGSGYSSLGVLKNYVFDELKLDMSFLRNFDERSRKIITAIVRMAKKLDVSTLAEGVETEEQYAFLREIGCEKIQGYYFARPMPFGEILPYLKRRGLGLEPAKWRAYFTKLSRIDYLTDTPLCVVDDDGVRLNILFANRAYREVLQRDHVRDLKEWENKINTPGDPIHIFHRQYADQQLRKQKGPQSAAYPSGDHYMMLTGSVAAMQDEHELYTVHIQYVEINAENFRQTGFETMSDLYYLCNDIAIYDLENDTVEGIKSSLSDQPIGVGMKLKSVSSVINTWKLNYCYLPDQDRFAEFMEIPTLKSRLENSENGVLSGMFRSLTASGEYQWFLHLIVPVQRSDFKKALHVTFKVRLNESDIIRIASSMRDAVSGQKSVGITDQLLWENMILNAKRMYFWKDTDRSFLGASKSFLQYFGFSSMKEIAGKTDEDMGWHIDPGPFKSDEEEVLRNGRKVYLRRGNCIVNGINREIIASKIPVYRGGRIIGILGTVFDEEEEEQFFSGITVRNSVDPLTGLANDRGLSGSIHSYLSTSWRTGMDFSIMEVYVPEYSEVVELYGDGSGDSLLLKISAALKNCAGTGCVIGRVQGSLFYILMHYSRREDVRNVAKKIRNAIESMRRAGQWSGNCSAVITAAYSDHVREGKSSYMVSLSGMILNDKNREEL